MEQIYYVDVHCHLIPGVDDGAKSMKESLAALKEQYDQNVRYVICTPHVTADLLPEAAENIRTSFDALERSLAKTTFGENIRLFLGCEIMYSESIIEKVVSGEIWTMGGSGYVLVEFLPSVSYEEICHAVRQLTDSGVLPILAHIERYQCLYKQIERIPKLQDMGAYCQINSSSLQGGLFNQRTAYIKKICKSGLIHFLGTDSHGMEKRRPDMKKGAEWVINNCNSQLRDRLLYRNGLDLLNDIII